MFNKFWPCTHKFINWRQWIMSEIFYLTYQIKCNVTSKSAFGVQKLSALLGCNVHPGKAVQERRKIKNWIRSVSKHWYSLFHNNLQKTESSKYSQFLKRTHKTKSLTICRTENYIESSRNVFISYSSCNVRTLWANIQSTHVKIEYRHGSVRTCMNAR